MLCSFSRSVVTIIVAACLVLLTMNFANAKVRFHSKTGWNTGGKTGNKQERLGAADANFDTGTGMLIINCYGMPFVTCWEFDGKDIWVYGIIGTPDPSAASDYCSTDGEVIITVE